MNSSKAGSDLTVEFGGETRASRLDAHLLHRHDASSCSSSATCSPSSVFANNSRSARTMETMHHRSIPNLTSQYSSSTSPSAALATKSKSLSVGKKQSLSAFGHRTRTRKLIDSHDTLALDALGSSLMPSGRPMVVSILSSGKASSRPVMRPKSEPAPGRPPGPPMGIGGGPPRKKAGL